ncbi:permease-like cell division protein FtsX [Spirillospora sp. NPDC047279]|uniref:permease-like cell division protein FtsX n=1 Tax=Spirillospora sp. NPDC047279 TaxID=3155478 RepID=UPI0033D52539
MNTTTEERLTEAMRAVGETFGPHDVPPLDLAGSRGRRSLRGRRPFAGRPMFVIAAAAASVVVAAGGTALIQNSGGGEPDVRHGPAVGSSTAGRGGQVAVFLCVKTSARPSCLGRDATPAQKESLRAGLGELPGVVNVEYESRQQAYERFRERFDDRLGFAANANPGDIPDAFLVGIASPGEAQMILDWATGLPGVDTAVAVGS